VQDFLKDFCERPEISRIIKRIYMLLGIDISLRGKFDDFIVNDDITH
jgi:hypothetical protein